MIPGSTLGFLLLDASLRPVFADPTVRSALAGPGESSSVFSAGLIRFKFVVEQLMSAGQPPAEFDFAGRRWRWSQFSCNCCDGGPQMLHAFVLGPLDPPTSHTVAIAAMYRLTQREAVALELYLQGLSAKEVAESMSVAPSTAKTFLRSICGKLGVTSRSELMSRVLSFTCSASFRCPFRVVTPNPAPI
jgi:DNA-binding CsgD family transcriptional regulator